MFKYNLLCKNKIFKNHISTYCRLSITSRLLNRAKYHYRHRPVTARRNGLTFKTFDSTHLFICYKYRVTD